MNHLTSMLNKNFIQKIAKAIFILIILVLIYGLSTALLLFTAGPLLQLGPCQFFTVFDTNIASKSCTYFSTKDILVSGLLFFAMLVSFYGIIYRNFTKYKTLQRMVVYGLFFGFSAVALYQILMPVIQWDDFLRFKIGGVNLKGNFFATTMRVAMACFLTYTLFTWLMELTQETRNLLRKLIYWFIATVIAGYSSILALMIYTGFDYQKKCFPFGIGVKNDHASDYCYQIGKSIFAWWGIIPAYIIFFLVSIFIIVYFAAKLSKTNLKK